MSVLRFIGYGIIAHALSFAYLILEIGSLWVLRIGIKWFWDVDYVEEIKKWLKGREKK